MQGTASAPRSPSYLFLPQLPVRWQGRASPGARGARAGVSKDAVAAQSWGSPAWPQPTVLRSLRARSESPLTALPLASTGPCRSQPEDSPSPAPALVTQQAWAIQPLWTALASTQGSPRAHAWLQAGAHASPHLGRSVHRMRLLRATPLCLADLPAAPGAPSALLPSPACPSYWSCPQLHSMGNLGFRLDSFFS